MEDALTHPTPRPGTWWIVRLEGGYRSHLVQVFELDPDMVTLHVVDLDREWERQRYQAADVEWVRVAPQYVTPVVYPSAGV